MSTRKTQFRFSSAVDVKLLKEVMLTNPTLDKDLYQDVADALNISGVNERNSRDRVKLLLGQFKSDNTKALKRSGSTEEYNEKMRLLQELADLERDLNKEIEQQKEREKETKKSKAQKTKKEREKATALRESALRGLVEDGGDDETYKPNLFDEISDDEASDVSLVPTPTGPAAAKKPKRERASRSSYLEFLRDKNEVEKQKADLERERIASSNEIRKKELDLEARKVAIAEVQNKNTHELVLAMLKKFQ